MKHTAPAFVAVFWNKKTFFSWCQSPVTTITSFNIFLTDLYTQREVNIA